MASPKVNYATPTRSSTHGGASYSVVGGVTAPRPPEADVQARTVLVTNEMLHVELTDGRSVSVPLTWFPRLIEASKRERKDYRLIGGGRLIHWDAVDEDIDVANLLRP